MQAQLGADQVVIQLDSSYLEPDSAAFLDYHSVAKVLTSDPVPEVRPYCPQIVLAVVTLYDQSEKTDLDFLPSSIVAKVE